MRTFKVTPAVSIVLLAFIACQVNQVSSMDLTLYPLEETGGWEVVRSKRSPVALSYDIDQQFESGLGPHHHHVEHHALALTHTITHGVAHPLPHGLGHAVSTTAGHGLLQTHPPPASLHPHAHHAHVHHIHKVGYGHGYSLGAYKGYGPAPHSVVNLHYGGFGVGIGYGGHGHGHGFFV
ncbi:kininogen-1 [Ischnura elegans]|uniref:kininogen-1 n=1 Tax=Ischnura elegans TaxID=197161 RepID=UPI001ED8851B|nr:kininogen-1 [Ischnura elegans]